VKVFEHARVVGKAVGGMVVHANRNLVAVKANEGAATSPLGLEGQANSLVLGEARKTAPSLEENTNNKLHLTTNPEGGPGESPQVSLGLGAICVVPRLPCTHWLELAFFFSLAHASPLIKRETRDR
jgi:hypothetical protein